MSPSRRDPSERAPHDVLGVDAGATPDELRAAHRELAKRAHPDTGGSVEAMQELNAALDLALRSTSRASTARDAPRTPRAPRPPRPRPRHGSGVRRDHPSFTIEALPVVAFEGLLLAADLLGEVVDDDPPYVLQAVLTDAPPCWSQLELVPDAGATSVTLSVARARGGPAVDIDDVRDRWIVALNRLDWSDPASPQPPS